MKPLFGGLTKGPTGVFKSVLDTARTDGKRRDEIYVDVVERLSATFNAAGNLVSSQIDGSIQVRVGGCLPDCTHRNSRCTSGLFCRMCVFWRSQSTAGVDNGCGRHSCSSGLCSSWEPLALGDVCVVKYAC
jgi:hypothetical protein